MSALAGGDPSDMTTTEMKVQIGAALASYKRGGIGSDELSRTLTNLTNLLNVVGESRKEVEKKRSQVLSRARFVFATLGSSSSDILREAGGFGLVIITRSNSACEAATLIPLRRSPRAVLIGDQHQIPPRVSEAGEWLGNHRSLFERLLSSGHPSVLLDRQGHCHPSLYLQPSQVMYGGEISNEVNSKILELFRWQLQSPAWYPSTFIDVRGEEEKVGTSWVNGREVRAVVDILKSIISATLGDPASIERGMDIALLSPYTAQTSAIARAVDELRVPGFINLRTSTVDAFQDDSCDIAITSCVRTWGSGFLSYAGRTNVAVTRASKLRVIVGSEPLLSQTALWADILECPTTAHMSVSTSMR